MDKKETVKKYILSQTEFDAPNVQNKYHISYLEMKEIIDELINEKKIEFVSGITYRTVNRSDEQSVRHTYEPQNEREAANIRALWECVKAGKVSPSLIQSKCDVSPIAAFMAIDWMEENGFVSSLPNREVRITKEQFIEKFGNPDGDGPSDDKEVQKRVGDRCRDIFRQLFENDDCDEEAEDKAIRKDFPKAADDISERNKRWAEMLRRTAAPDDDEEGVDDEEEFDIDDDDEGEFDVDDEEFDEDEDIFETDDDDEFDIDNEEDDEGGENECKAVSVDFMYALMGYFENHLKFPNAKSECVLDLGGTPPLELKLIQEDGVMRITDDGKTLPQSGLTRRKVINILKAYAPVRLDYHDEISITAKEYTDTFRSLLTLYSAVDAVRQAAKSKGLGIYADGGRDYKTSIKRLCRALSNVAVQKANGIAPTKLTLATLYGDGFDMQAAIESVPDLDERIERGCREATLKCIEADLDKKTEPYEDICMDIIDSIIKMNRDWKRADAIREAAKEMVAVEYHRQKAVVSFIHKRVVKEFSIATDKEYDELKKLLWDE